MHRWNGQEWEPYKRPAERRRRWLAIGAFLLLVNVAAVPAALLVFQRRSADPAAPACPTSADKARLRAQAGVLARLPEAHLIPPGATTVETFNGPSQDPPGQRYEGGAHFDRRMLLNIGTKHEAIGYLRDEAAELGWKAAAPPYNDMDLLQKQVDGEMALLQVQGDPNDGRQIQLSVIIPWFCHPPA